MSSFFHRPFEFHFLKLNFRNRLSIICCLILSFTILNVQAQDKAPKELSWRKNRKVADDLFERGSYYNAVQYYEKAFKQKPAKIYLAYQIAECNFLLRDYSVAANWYTTVLAKDTLKYPAAQFGLAMSLKAQGDYQLASSAFDVFRKRNYKDRKGEVENLKRIAAKEIQGCQYGLTAMMSPVNYKVENAGEAVNSPYTDFGAIYLSNSEMLYSSLNTDTLVVLGDETMRVIFSMIYSSTNQNGIWSEGKALERNINSGKEHSGNASISPDGNRFYFTRCMPGENLQMECVVYVSEKKDGQWQSALKLDGNINAAESNNTHPFAAINNQGKEVLFFSSDRDGGRGGMDLYVAVRKADGSYEAAKNLASTINTTRDEVTPFYDSKKNILYFSSNGQTSMGGFDINQVEALPDFVFGEVTNVGYPLNSSYDDTYFSLNQNGTAGFLVSNRPGGTSLKGATCCDDIWTFKTKELNLAVEGMVYEDEAKKITAKSGTVGLFSSTDGAMMESQMIQKNKSYFFKLKEDQQYFVRAWAENYEMAEQKFKTIDMENSDTLHFDLMMKSKGYFIGMNLGTIYYNFDETKFRTEMIDTLNEVVSFLKSHPYVIIECAGHTDDVGTEEYNQKLSDHRADVAYGYIMLQGIPEKQLSQKGHGEKFPKAENKVNGKDNPANRSLNRRVEFTVVGELPH